MTKTLSENVPLVKPWLTAGTARLWLAVLASLALIALPGRAYAQDVLEDLLAPAPAAETFTTVADETPVAPPQAEDEAEVDPPPAAPTPIPLNLDVSQPVATDAAALGSAIISGGDTVRVMMLEDPEVTYEGAVAASGSIPIPYLGEFAIVGLTEAAAEQELGDLLQRELYQRATVSVTLVSRGPGSIYLYGAVSKPGAFGVPKYGNMTILQLLLQSGGLTGWAAPDATFVLRHPPGTDTVERVSVDLREIFASAIPQGKGDLPLMDGDIVCVPGMNGELYQFMSMEDREIIVIGEVGRPGLVTFGPGEIRTVMRAIFKAGSFSQFAKRNAVRIIRYERNQERSEMVVDAEEIMEKGYLHKDVELQPGDMLIVPTKRINL